VLDQDFSFRWESYGADNSLSWSGSTGHRCIAERSANETG